MLLSQPCPILLVLMTLVSCGQSEIVFECSHSPTWFVNPQRVEFLGTDILVSAFPSIGGVLHRKVTALDLDFLNVSRRHSTPCSNPWNVEEEDEWAKVFRRLAPPWFSTFVGSPHCVSSDIPKTAIEDLLVYVAWPSNGKGVWVKRFRRGNEPYGFAAYHASLTQDERCAVIEEFGGEFYHQASHVFELTEGYQAQMQEDFEELKQENPELIDYFRINPPNRQYGRFYEHEDL